MSFLAPLCALALGFVVGGVGGIILGFVWYERKCGLLSDRSGERAAAIKFELDDVFGRPAARDPRDAASRRKFAFPTRVKQL